MYLAESYTLIFLKIKWSEMKLRARNVQNIAFPKQVSNAT